MTAIDHDELAIVKRLVSADQLNEALSRERVVTSMKLGTRLLELNLITEEQLQGALHAQASNPHRHLGEILLDLGLVSRAHLSQVLCEKLGIPLVDLERFAIDGGVTRMLPEDLVRAAQVVPLCQVDGKLVVAVSDPFDTASLERVRFFVQRPVTPVMALREEIEEAIRTLYGEPTAREPADSREVGELQIDLAPVDESMVGFVDKLIVDACAAYASTIHIDSNTGPQPVMVRFRRHGQLTEYTRLPAQSRSALIARIKSIAGIDIADRRHGHEGRIDYITPSGRNVQLRVVTVPTREGNEDAAIEMVTAREPLPLNMLGLRQPVLDAVSQLVARRQGLVIVAGPSGSGKATLLHALLTLVDPAGRKIYTIENQAGITHPGVSQIEVNPKIGWDYATTVRSVGRADPDIIMIGEVRDHDTAAAAMEASLRRCVVFGALQGTGAVEAVARLVEMGLDVFGLADALAGAIGQRLARRLCLNCRTVRRATATEIEALLQEYCAEGGCLDVAQIRKDWLRRFGGDIPMYEANGCNVCAGTGYHGRIGFHELLLGGPATRQLILQRRPFEEFVSSAVRGGMRTLKQDGIEKALEGHCDLREVRTATL